MPSKNKLLSVAEVIDQPPIIKSSDIGAQKKSVIKQIASNNRTIKLSPSDIKELKNKSIHLSGPLEIEALKNQIIHQDMHQVLDFLPDSFIDVAFLDPPYNLSKQFNGNSFKEMTSSDYEIWMESWLSKMIRLLKPEASIYICGDWRSSAAIYNTAKKYFHIHNRITFEREKGRGAKTNWKNCSEDIWFCTLSKKYYFDVDAVKMKRKVLAPYRDNSGRPKDWQDNGDDKYRTTYPSNLWTDLTIPFWSMTENTDHPTQKPEKLLAKIILASSRPGDLIFDPFLGAGTSAVTAQKLSRQFVGIEIDELYCCLAHKRLKMAQDDSQIQGYEDGLFWERNSGQNHTKKHKRKINLEKDNALRVQS
ncbi:MAG: site-specific DNA-methyltransferase [Candidatus Portiera sp.]|nr:site-specific DNA-methyltransferase [Portiera sp.]